MSRVRLVSKAIIKCRLITDQVMKLDMSVEAAWEPFSKVHLEPHDLDEYS